MGRIVSRDSNSNRGKVLGIIVTMSMEKLKGMIKIMDNRLKGLEERTHKGGKVRGREMVEFKMKLSILEILL